MKFYFQFTSEYHCLLNFPHLLVIVPVLILCSVVSVRPEERLLLVQNRLHGQKLQPKGALFLSLVLEVFFKQAEIARRLTSE